MKTKLLFIALVTSVLSSCGAQSQTTVYAKNSDISDNLDLRAVASMFGESANLQDFERRLNDPKYQISNLDLNGDDEVDYLRVIESVEDRTHVVIIQAVLDRDVYQDVATIDVERDNYNKVSVQVVGNTYLYGDNYIYEPVYSVVPVIYTSFWVTNYRPYYSTWYWGYYPTYYSAWRPYPVYRYRNNINVCINVHNSYNYVNTRRSYRAPAIYETRRTYGYERMRPNFSFADRHSNVSNRYDLDQRRIASRDVNRNSNNYNYNRSNNGRPASVENRNTTRDYNSGRNTSDRSYSNTNRVTNNNRDNSANVNTPARNENTQRPDYGRNNSSPSVSRGNSENRNYTNRTSTQENQPQRSYSENRGSSSNRASTPQSAPVQRTEAPRGYSENRSNSNVSRPQSAPQRSESPRMSQESRGGQSQRESGNGSRGGGRRG
ncbi:hypothetical protein [Flavobacterium sp.]|uniref:hypothetical protein n=1 Tax=Flavobacterium sp. TaxID=239 RepID=UPI0031D427F2